MANAIRLEIKNCFGCNKPTINYIFDPYTVRYFGLECVKQKERNLVEFKSLECFVCGQSEEEIMAKEEPSTGLRWVKNRLLCYVCYLGSDEYKKEKEQLQKKRTRLENEAREYIIKEREAFKKINGVYPEEYNPVTYRYNGKN